MKKITLLIWILIFSNICVNSQVMSSKYSRNIISYGFLNRSFVLNDDDIISINPNYLEIAKVSGYQIANPNDINKSLIENQIPAKIFNSILIGPNGDINTDYIFDRGEYNANDADIFISKFAKEGKSLIQNLGFDVIDKIHIIIFDQFTTDNKFNPITYRAYLYKININKNDFWDRIIDPKTNKLSHEKINAYDFKLDLVAMKEAKSIERLFIKLGRKYKPLRVTSSITSTDPLSSKIGTKEGVRVNDLFQVLENKKNSNNRIVQTSKGYVRVKSVADNSGIAKGNSSASTFYNIFSGPLDKGMILRSSPSRGIYIGASKFLSSDDKSLLNGYMYQVDYLSHKYKGVYYSLGIGISDTIKSKSFIYPGGVEKSDTTAVLSGLNFQFIIGKNIQLNFIEVSPQFGLNVGSYPIDRYLVNNKPINNPLYSQKDGVSAWSFITGLKVGVNLGKSFQIYASMNQLLGNSSFGLTSSLDKPESNKTHITFNNSSTIKIGVRLIGL